MNSQPPKRAVTVPAPLRAVSYRYMHDMANHKIRAYGDAEYGDIQDIDVTPDCMTGMFNDVCVVSNRTGTWVVRHHKNGSMYFEPCKGVADESKVDVSPIIVDTRQ